jgi:LPS O-antigen subunit length determinant protein (WzzB/FepE family)
MTTEQFSIATCSNAPPPLEQPVDLLHFVYLLFDTKWIIILGSLFCGYAALLYANTLPDIYESIALVDIIEQGNAGGIDPDNRVAAKSIGLLETGFVLNTSKENYTKIVYSRLNSRKFIRFFMEKHNIYALLYKEEWDDKKQQWRDGFVLDKGKAFIRFEREFISIYQNEESEIVAIAVRNSDPVLAAKLANLYVKEFNDYMRQITLAGVAAKIAFLQQNLEKAEYPALPPRFSVQSGLPPFHPNPGWRRILCR